MNRRTLLKGLLATAATTVIRVPIGIAAGAPVTRFGVITDVHQDVMPDAVDRMRAFVAAMREAKAEFVIQLGDFCMPKASNREFLAAWNAFPGPRYHVIGNHDIEAPFTREQTAAFWGMPGLHYTFDAGAFAGIVLDANEPGGKATVYYPRYIGPDQLAWLERTAMASAKPVIVFVHQPIDYSEGLENGSEVRAVLARVEAARPGGIQAVFAGHFHQDGVQTFAGSLLPFVQVNSASYYWLGDAGQSLDYFPPDMHERYPGLRNVAVYKDPLWAIVDVDPAAGEMRITGRRTQWVGISALERLKQNPVTEPRAYMIRPEITSRRFNIPVGRAENPAAGLSTTAWSAFRAQPGSVSRTGWA